MGLHIWGARSGKDTLHCCFAVLEFMQITSGTWSKSQHPIIIILGTYIAIRVCIYIRAYIAQIDHNYM